MWFKQFNYPQVIISYQEGALKDSATAAHLETNGCRLPKVSSVTWSSDIMNYFDINCVCWRIKPMRMV